MRITISSSSSEIIDDLYKEESKKAIEYLANNGYDLNWGSGSISIMGLCYEGFKNSNRKIFGYTTNKYKDDIDNLPAATHKIYDDTFDLKKYIYNDADILLCLPGGTGTISEFFSYIEESRSNDNFKKVVLYNINGHFNKTIELIDDLVERNFNSKSIYDYFIVVNNYDEFVDLFSK